MLLSTAQRTTIESSTPPTSPRLVLAPARGQRAVLDGGWWPRSWDPEAELPGLVLALSARYGTIRQLMLNSVTWDSRFSRLAVGDGVVRVGWFNSVDPAVAIATTYTGDQIDLLVVPPRTAPAPADKAMREAADPANRTRARAILAALPTAQAGVRASDGDGQPEWDNEGGHTVRPTVSR
jgi:hypothetical protein